MNSSINFKILLHKFDFESILGDSVSFKPWRKDPVQSPLKQKIYYDLEQITTKYFNNWKTAKQKLKEKLNRDPATTEILRELERQANPLHWENAVDTKYVNHQTVSVYHLRYLAFIWTLKYFLVKKIQEDLGSSAPKKYLKTYIIGSTTSTSSPVVSISNFNTSLTRFNNSLSIVLDATKISITDVYNKSSGAEFEENDIIELRVRRENESTFPLAPGEYIDDEGYRTEFLGFIGTISQEKRYGQLLTYTINCFGLSKFLSLQGFNLDRAAQSQVEDADLEVSNPDFVAYMNVLNDKNLTQFFETIVTRVLGINRNKDLESKLSFTDEISGIIHQKQLYTRDNQLYTNISASTLKNILDAGDISKMEKQVKSIASFSISNFLLTNFYLTREYDGSKQKDDISKVVAVLEGTDTELVVYNKMVKQAFKTFYNILGTPDSLLQQLRSVCYYDIYEDRPSVIYCRPPRYNLIKLEANNKSLTVTDFERKLTNISYVDQVIYPENIIEEVYSRDDTRLMTRIDYKYLLPFVGGFPIIGSHYTDPFLLIKYGWRATDPKENPNVTLGSTMSATYFSALDLHYSNAITRKLVVTVYNNRPYKLGRLYYLPNKDDYTQGKVGYLTNISTVYEYGRVPMHTLEFVFVRDARVMEDPETKNAILDFKLIPDILSFAVTAEIFGEQKVSNDMPPFDNKLAKVDGWSAEYNDMFKEFFIVVNDVNISLYKKQPTTNNYEVIRTTVANLPPPRNIKNIINGHYASGFYTNAFEDKDGLSQINNSFLTGLYMLNEETENNKAFDDVLPNRDLQYFKKYVKLHTSFLLYRTLVALKEKSKIIITDNEIKTILALYIQDPNNKSNINLTKFRDKYCVTPLEYDVSFFDISYSSPNTTKENVKKWVDSILWTGETFNSEYVYSRILILKLPDDWYLKKYEEQLDEENFMKFKSLPLKFSIRNMFNRNEITNNLGYMSPSVFKEEFGIDGNGYPEIEGAKVTLVPGFLEILETKELISRINATRTFFTDVVYAIKMPKDYTVNLESPSYGWYYFADEKLENLALDYYRKQSVGNFEVFGSLFLLANKLTATAPKVTVPDQSVEIPGQISLQPAASEILPYFDVRKLLVDNYTMHQADFLQFLIDYNLYSYFDLETVTEQDSQGQPVTKLYFPDYIFIPFNESFKNSVLSDNGSFVNTLNTFYNNEYLKTKINHFIDTFATDETYTKTIFTDSLKLSLPYNLESYLQDEIVIDLYVDTINTSLAASLLFTTEDAFNTKYYENIVKRFNGFKSKYGGTAYRSLLT